MRNTGPPQKYWVLSVPIEESKEKLHVLRRKRKGPKTLVRFLLPQEAEEDKLPYYG